MLKNLFNPEFYLKHGIKLVLIIASLTAIICYIFDCYNMYDFDAIHAVIVIDFLFAKESILITIAAVLIGIYFGIFTHLLTANKGSAIFSLDKRTMQELISFLKMALSSSFIYLFWALLHPYNYFESHFFHFIIELTLGIAVLYMLLTALRVGGAFIYIFTKDVNSLYDNLQKEHQKQEELNAIMYKINACIEKEELEKAQEKAKMLNREWIKSNPQPKRK